MISISRCGCGNWCTATVVRGARWISVPIERDSQIAIQRKNPAAEQQILELQPDEEYARLELQAPLVDALLDSAGLKADKPGDTLQP